MGDFEIGFSEIQEEDEVYRISDFVLNKQREFIDISDLARQGYPFKINDMIVKKNVGKMKGRFYAEFGLQAVNVELNNKELGVLYGFNDLPFNAQNNNNELRLTLSMNLRNLFGPFHNKIGDLSTVCPETFEEIDRTDYSVVKQGVKELYVMEETDAKQNIEKE